jgi:GH18 family chitinase
MTYMSRMISNRNFYKNPGVTVLIATLMGLGSCVTTYGASTTESTPPRLIGYLPGYTRVSYTDYAQKIDFSGITHLNLAFGNPPKCDGACTSHSKMDFSIKGQSDADVTAIVRAAHAAKVKVLLSIGGGGGDQLILPFYNAGLSDQLVGSLDKYLRAHDLDGVDVDIEDPSNMGAPFAKFVDVLVATFRPEGKLVTAAVAKYLQDSMPDSALHQFDFINVMVYSSYAQAATALDFYSVQKKVPRNQIVLGVPFFGSNTSDTKEEDYQALLSAYPNAWKVDSVGGGSLDDGQNFNYVGENTMAKETLLSKKFGGMMIWEMMADAPAPHSLLDLIRKNLFSAESITEPCSGTQSTSSPN